MNWLFKKKIILLSEVNLWRLLGFYIKKKTIKINKYRLFSVLKLTGYSYKYDNHLDVKSSRKICFLSSSPL